jgi:hypothetical protein
MAIYYVYIHKKNNIPFYVDNKPKHARAYRKCSRSKEWHEIAKSGYDVDVILENLTLEQASFCEKWLIATYGRKDKNKGILVNHTDGGMGCPGLGTDKKKASWTPEKRAAMAQKMRKPKAAGIGEKIRQALTGGKHSVKHNFKKPILQCDLEGNIIKEWSSNDEAARTLNISRGGICSCCKGTQKTSKGFIWKYK